MTLKELVGILKVHEQDLAQDEGTKKGKLLSLADQRPKRNFVSKETSSKAFVVKYASEKESNDDDSNKEDNELSLITRKIKKIGKIRTPLEAMFESKEDLIKGYNQLLSASACVSKAYRKLNKHFQHLEGEHEDLKKAHRVHLVDFILETTSLGSVQDACACEEVKALLGEKEVKALVEEKVSSERKIILKDFQDLEERVKSLTITLEDSEEEHKEMLK
ncbi:hypothetical protein JHK85_040928 [Glycine max]|nr:hypothetical protein JHK85_040928 [Glycine max]